MEGILDELLGTTEDEIPIDAKIRQAVIARDADQVEQLLKARDRADIEATVKQIAELQNAIFEKESEREALTRELDHLSEPVKVALQGVASALEALEERRIDLGLLQLRQGCIDQGLESLRQEINDMRKQLSEMMETISE